MVQYYTTIGVTLIFIIGLVTPLVGLTLGLRVNSNHNVQLLQWVQGKAKYTPPLTSLDACGDRKKLKARQNRLANLKILIQALRP